MMEAKVEENLEKLKVEDAGEGMSYFCYQDILTNTVSRVFEDLNFKISEGSDQN